MKSVFAIMAAMILALVLVACGGQEGESTTPVEEAATTEEPVVDEPAVEEPAVEEPAVDDAAAEPVADEPTDEPAE